MNKGCLIGLVSFLVLGAFGLGWYFYSQNNSDPVVYETTKPEYLDIIKKTVATGSIKPRKEVNIKPQVSGVIEKLFVEAGAIVTKGQKLAKIKLIPSLVNINNAESSVELARIRYENAKRELARQKEVFNKKLDVDQAKVAFENAEQEEKRQRNLFEDGIISEIEYNRFKLDMNLRKSEFENSKILATNNLKQFESEVDIRQQEVDAAVSNLQLLKEGASRKSKQVSNLVVSTVSGMVLSIPVEEGSSVIERNTFNEGTSIAAVADMNSLIFEGKIDESDVGKLKEGMPLVLTVGAIQEEKFDATLEYISPKGEEEEGTVKFTVRAAVQPKNDIFLRAGYSANGDIIIDQKDSVISIKERDVIYKNDSTFVEVKTGDQEFEKREVKLGISDGIQVEVLNGLDTATQIKMIKNTDDSSDKEN